MNVVKNKKTLLTIIFIGALVVRLGAMIALESYKFSTDEEFGFGYGETAKQVALGEGFSLGYFDSGAPRATAVAPPGYVYLIALIFSVFGIYSVPSAIIIEVLQSLAAAFTCLVFYHLGRRFHEAVGLLAALVMAFYPSSIMFSVMRISPILLVVLLLGIIMLYLFRIQERWQTRDAVVCGILMGVNVLMEPTVILFYVASCLWLFFWSSHKRLAAVKSAMIMGTVCFLCMLPWTIRNYLIFNAFVPVKSSIGRNLLQGNHPYSNGITFGPEIKNVFSEEELKAMKNLTEAQENDLMQRKAIEFIKADPARFLKNTLRRIYYYWGFTNPYRPTPYDALRVVTYGPVLIFGILGLVYSGKQWREGSLFLSLFLSFPLFYYITQVTINRYRLVPEVFLIVPACLAVVELTRRFNRSRAPIPSGVMTSLGTASAKLPAPTERLRRNLG